MTNMRTSTKIILAFAFAVVASMLAGYDQSTLFMIASAFVSLGAGSILASRTSKPVEALAEKVDEIAEGNYDIEFRAASGKELQKLTESMQELVRHIKDEAAIAHSIQRSIESPFFMADTQTVLTYINRSACDLMKVKAEDVVGRVKVFDLFGSDRATRNALDGKPIPGYEVNIRNWENESIPVIASSGPIRKANGDIVGAFLTFIDMREAIRKQQEYLEQQIRPIAVAIQAIAKGDLTADVEVSEGSQLHQLGMEVRKMIDNLRHTLEQVSEASVEVASASDQISGSTEEISAGAQEQSNQISEVAAAVEEMARTVSENSRNASITVEMAKKNGVVAEEGGRIVSATVTKIKDIAGVVQGAASTVERLGSSTQEIGEIILVIDEIAEQTNLLALNAAIEAARAGEEGRGFAVVADEVRKLAERTAKATKQIASMIKNVQADAKAAVDSMKKGNTEVNQGIELADKAGSSLKSIVGNMQEVVRMITQIATASMEQTSTSEQVSQNVEAISQVSAESASGLAQIARAAESMTELTHRLQSATNQFKIKGNAGRQRKFAASVVETEA